MSYRTRVTVPPQLEIIRAHDDTVRAELIAAPVVRADAGTHTVANPAALAAMTVADDARPTSLPA